MYPGTVARLADVTVPALVITGEDDRIAPRANAENLAGALPNARLLVIPGAGHMVITDQPEALASAITGFTAEVGVAGGLRA